MITIRNEKADEFRAVEELTREAFWNLYVPGCSEHYCLHNMRSHSDFITELDFIAEQEGQVVGNIVHTLGKIVGDSGKEHRVISFGPVSVLPSFQKQGIGSALIKHSLDKAKTMGFSAVCIYGDPRYYSRFGFRCAERYDISNSDGKFAVALMAFELVQGALNEISGRFMESEAYGVDEDGLQKFEATFPVKEKAVTPSQSVFNILASLVY
jgi:putative acetyltransferase